MASNGRLSGKTALVTGGTSGIGRKTAERFIEEGARVWFTGRRAALGAEVAAETGAGFIEADASSEADAQRAIDTVVSEGGRIDILVNNAGGPGPTGTLLDVPMDGFEATLATHVSGVFAHIKHAAKHMKTQRGGAIVNISSIAGHRAGYTSSIAYAIAKSAVLHMTRCTAMELSEHRIRVNSVSPGVIATGIFGKAMGIEAAKADASAEKIQDALKDFQAIDRAGQPLDIANAILFLASDEASFVTGDDIAVEGGVIWGRRFSEANKGGHAWARFFE